MTAADDPYGAEVRRLFRVPLHGGSLADARVARAVGQGAAVELYLKSRGTIIEALRFRARGCPHFLAAAEAFCRDFEGRPTAALAGYSALEVVRNLPVPVEKTGRILVLEDAVHSLGT